MGEQKCRQCGCTDDRACVHADHGPCWWVEDDLCSHCQMDIQDQCEDPELFDEDIDACPECGCDANPNNENNMCNDCRDEMNKVGTNVVRHYNPKLTDNDYPADDLPF